MKAIVIHEFGGIDKLRYEEIETPEPGDGQVLVTDDLLGLNETNIRFVKKFVNIKKIINKGIKKFKREVISKKYPSKKYSY